MLALASGLSLWVLVARVVVKADALDDGPVLVITLALAVAAIAALIGPGRPTLRALWTRSSAAFLGWGAGSTLLGGAALLRTIARRRDAFTNPTPWYYWDLVRQTLGAHGNPVHSFEWGKIVGFLDDYPGFTAGTGVLAVLAGASTVAAAQVVTVTALFAAGAGVFLLTRALGGSRPGAAVATVLFFTLAIFVVKLAAFRPEAFGYAFVFVLPVLALDWFEHRRPAVLAVTAMTFAALGQVHGVDWFVGATFVVAAALAAVPGRAGLRRWARGAAALLGTAFATWVALNLALSGTLSGVGKVSGLPHLGGGTDPTWQFFRAAQGLPASKPPTAADLADGSLRQGIVGLSWRWFAVVAAIVLVALVVRAIAGRTAGSRAIARRALVFVGISAAVVFAACVAFAVRWDTYVPRRTGFGRMLQLLPMLVAVGLGVAVSVRIRRLPRGLATTAVPLVAGLLALGALVHALPKLDEYAQQTPPAETLASLRSMHLPPRAIVLTNSYVEGLLAVTSDARVVLSGRAPYTEQKLLTRANRLFDSTARFLARPDGAALPCTGITRLVLATDPAWRLGTPFVIPTDFAALDAQPDLRLELEGAGFRVYRVLPGSHRPRPKQECAA